MVYTGERDSVNKSRAALSKGWVIANHILVSFHVAFISSVLSVPGYVQNKAEVLRFMFVSHETIISLLFWYVTFHIGVAWHEMGHYVSAIRLSALNTALLGNAQKNINKPFWIRIFWYLWILILIPFGKVKGVRKTGLEYHPDAPYNLAVSAAGPAASQKMAMIAFPAAIVLLTTGLMLDVSIAVYLGRLFLGLGAVGLFDFLFADPGKFREFKLREMDAAKAAKKIEVLTTENSEGWGDRVKKVKNMMIQTRMQRVVTRRKKEILVPWEFRNCGMGGRHTEKEFPESNISLQESMFIPLSVHSHEEAQEMTVNLQTRLKEIIENSEGCTMKGIGTEGGIAAYIGKEEGDILPVQRLWRMQKQAIVDCGYIPGKDVVMALDPAASELENAYKISTGVMEEIGTYEAWRDENEPVLSRDDLLEIYRKAIEDDGLPIVSIEDGFAEDDDEGWKLIMEKLGDKIHIIGDDNVTTKDSSIEEKADERLINTVLIKLNQIGTITEGVLALLTAIGKNLEIVVSHRSKSPIEDFEAHVALAANSLGLKAGGGSNSERLHKYESIVKVIKEVMQRRKKRSVTKDKMEDSSVRKFIDNTVITEIVAHEASTNAGIPTVGVEVKVGIEGSDTYFKLFSFEGSTPLGTSAGTDEAIHLIDSIIQADSPVAKKFPDLFVLNKTDKTYRFKKEVDDEKVIAKNDKQLSGLWQRVKRYRGKGCLNAVDNVLNIIAQAFVGRKIFEIGEVVDIDKKLLDLEKQLAYERGVLTSRVSEEEEIMVMQRKGNLGMNAILSVSLALARLKGSAEGMALWEVIRQQITTTISKTIAANGGIQLFDVLKEDIISHRKRAIMLEKQTKKGLTNEAIGLTREEEVSIINGVNEMIERLKQAESEKALDLWKIIEKELTFHELSMGLRKVNEEKRKNVKLYQLLREQLPVYNTEQGVA